MLHFRNLDQRDRLARASIVIPARAARWLIVVALISGRSDRVQGRRGVIAGRFVGGATAVNDHENGPKKKPE
jgi:hypothetical protein